MKEKQIIMAVTEDEEELLATIRNYNKSFPDGYPELLWYVQRLVDNMLRHLEYLGYYGSKVDAQAQVHGQKVKVRYEVDLGRRFRISEVKYILPERGTLAEDFLKDTVNVTVRKGDWLSEEALEAETL